MAPVHLITLGFQLLALLCWAVMFLAGTDVWHAFGRPDFWHLAEPPYSDMRALACAFYLLFGVQAAQVVATVSQSSLREGANGRERSHGRHCAVCAAAWSERGRKGARVVGPTRGAVPRGVEFDDRHRRTGDGGLTLGPQARARPVRRCPGGWPSQKKNITPAPLRRPTPSVVVRDTPPNCVSAEAVFVPRVYARPTSP